MLAREARQERPYQRILTFLASLRSTTNGHWLVIDAMWLKCNEGSFATGSLTKGMKYGITSFATTRDATLQVTERGRVVTGSCTVVTIFA